MYFREHFIIMLFAIGFKQQFEAFAKARIHNSCLITQVYFKYFSAFLTEFEENRLSIQIRYCI